MAIQNRIWSASLVTRVTRSLRAFGALEPKKSRL
jgi:hypothetical protein